MGKIAFVFPGQGAQYAGMGKELYENLECCRRVFDTADKELGFSISEICFGEDENLLSKTEITQPAIVTMSIAALQALKANNINCDMVGGLSLGEYSALVCSGAMSFEDAVKIVRKRGQFMQDAVEEGKGTVAAIIGLDKTDIDLIIEEASKHGIIEISNMNCPKQIVIGGEVKAVEEAMKLANERGAKRALKLKVSSPFHTSMLEPAAIKLKDELINIDINNPKIPLIANITGDFVSEEDNLVQMLSKQVMSTTLWEKSMRKMIENGVDTFIEIGPGRVLSGFVKKIDRKLKVFNVENMESLNKVIEELSHKEI